MSVVVINHLHLREPLDAEPLQQAMQAVVDAGGIAARVVQVDEAHLVLLLEFADADDAGRIAREVGGPWMNEHVVPKLARPTDRAVGRVVAAA